jgi:16S rRNA (cytosine1402-N4)-methyltransferase
MTPAHHPVMVTEALRLLAPARGGLFVDCTVGLGGHTRALLDAGATQVIGFDRDREALALARETLAGFANRVELIHADYREMAAELDARGRPTVDGVLADLGVSSLQLDSATRGFSFRQDAPADMRMDTSRGPTVADLLRDVDETTLADVIFQFGEERFSRRIARAMVRAQDEAPITTTGRLADVIRRAVPRRGYQRIDPATRTFQALRIWVNRELDGLDDFVRTAAHHLRPGARLVVITFHSLEDRIVKHTLRELDRERGLLRVLTKKPIEATEAEIEANPRARSAKLRAAERLDPTAVATPADKFARRRAQADDADEHDGTDDRDPGPAQDDE